MIQKFYLLKTIKKKFNKGITKSFFILLKYEEKKQKTPNSLDSYTLILYSLNKHIKVEFD